MRRLVVVISAVVLFAGVGASTASAQTTDAVSVARSLIDAENAHNVAAAVGSFAPGAIVNLPTGTLVTRAEIQQWQQELAAGNFHATISAPLAVTPEVVTFSGSVTLDLFRSLGLSSLDATWQLTIQLGKVTTFNFDFTPAATARLQAALGGGAGTAASTAPASGGAAAAPAAGATAATATPAAATSGTLALTGASLLPAAIGGISILVGVVMLGLERPRRQPLR